MLGDIYTEYYMSKSVSHADQPENHISPQGPPARGAIQILTSNVHYIIYFNHAFHNTCIL